MIALLSLSALAGYGDPVAGIPTPAEREVHLWTNAVRNDPAAFDYPCAFDGFEDAEKVPQPPLLWDDGLGEAARFHSDDMRDNSHFSHSSSDGTSFGDRLSRYYSAGMAGENIAQGYSDAYDVVVNGWMCSSGHRSNIMLPGFNELGTGVAGRYYTQDFGGSGERITDHPVLMAAHTPADASVSATLLASVVDPGGAPAVRAVVDGQALEMALVYGDASAGTWAVDLPANGSCVTYHVEAVLADGSTARYPEGGRYGFGPTCVFDDVEAQFVAGAGASGGSTGGTDDDEGVGLGGGLSFDEGGDDDDEGEARSCSTVGGLTGAWWLVGLLGVMRRRR